MRTHCRARSPERAGDDSIARNPREDGMTIIKAGARLAALCAGLTMAGAAWAADTYPDHKIRMIVPFGAGGNLGVETAKRAAPDGYTIVTVSTGFIINPSMYTTIGYDPLKDFAPISLVAASPNVITVHPSLAGKNLKELIHLIKP